MIPGTSFVNAYRGGPSWMGNDREGKWGWYLTGVLSVETGDGDDRRVMTIFHPRSCLCLFRLLVHAIFPVDGNLCDRNIAPAQILSQRLLEILYGDAPGRTIRKLLSSQNPSTAAPSKPTEQAPPLGMILTCHSDYRRRVQPLSGWVFLTSSRSARRVGRRQP